MILLNDFFFIQQEENIPGSLKTTISINPQHKIFDGHFPGKPIVPGVCMVQIIIELMEKVMLKKVKLREADAIKFLAVMNPTANNEIDVTINYIMEGNKWLIDASLFSGSAQAMVLAVPITEQVPTLATSWLFTCEISLASISSARYSAQ